MDPVEEALAKAGNRLLVVDFYTTWCGPCRRLDQITWPDPAVKAWFDAKALLLKVDGEKHEALTERFKVAAFPTIVLLRPDGTELDRLVGFRGPREFLAEVESALAGKDAVARARDAVRADGGLSPKTRFELGQVLVEKGDDEGALAEFLWCFDHGEERDETFAGVRLSFLLDALGWVARRHPPALVALRERRDRAAAALEADPGSRWLGHVLRRLDFVLKESGG